MNRNQPLKLFFIISLLVNLLLAGMIIGQVWWHVSGHWEFATHALTQSLPPEKQQAVTATLQKIHEDIKTLRRQSSAARDETARLLGAEPFDKTAYLTAVKHMQELHMQMSNEISHALADLAEQLSPDERPALADMMRNLSAADIQTDKPDWKKIHPNSQK